MLGLRPIRTPSAFALQSALVGALQDSFPLRLGDCRNNGHHHPSHRSFSNDAVVQEADGHTASVAATRFQGVARRFHEVGEELSTSRWIVNPLEFAEQCC